MCDPLRKCLRGRENACCFCCKTWIGMHLVNFFNIFMLMCAVLNMIRIFQITFDLGIFYTVIAYSLRVVLKFRMCCDSIKARYDFMLCMWITSIIEAVIYLWEFTDVFISSEVYCDPAGITPMFNMNCAWAMTVILGLNAIIINLNFYFSAVAYEHYHRGQKKPKLAAREVQRRVDENQMK